MYRLSEQVTGVFSEECKSWKCENENQVRDNLEEEIWRLRSQGFKETGKMEFGKGERKIKFEVNVVH